MRVDQHSSPSEDMSKSVSPIWGSNMRVFTMRSAIKKGGSSCGDEDRLHRPQVDYAQGKGVILIGFLFYRSHDVS